VSRARTVVVTDGDQRAALATVRSLGRAGWRVVVASPDGRSVAGASRFAASDHAVPDPLSDPAGYRERVGAIVRRADASLVVPVTEAAALALLEDPAALAPATIASPDLERFRRVADKAAVLEAAREVGIAAPEQVTLESPRAAVALAGMAFPLVVKPSRSVGGAGSDRRKLGVRHAANEAELRAILGALPAAAWPVLVQRRIVGPGVGIFLLAWQGRLVARFAHRRLREKPPSGGVSTYRESIAADPGLVERSRALLDRFGWEGVAMIEYKVEASTGTPHLMEVNGRLWGSVQLAVDAGVDFPALLAAAYAGDPLPTEPPGYRTGIRLRWEWGDVDHVLARLRRRDAENALAPGEPSRLRALGAVLLPWRPGDRLEVLRLGDPRPFLRESARWFQGR
jgi:predicted ATP-grasp superfamily ATP-dependent carboligase